MKPLHHCILHLLFAVFLLQNLAAQNEAPAISPNIGGCAFDELNHQHSPEIKQEIKDFLENAVPLLSSQQRSAVEPLLSVAVVVHVIHEGEPVGTGRNISTEQVLAQIEVINEDFTSLNGRYYSTPGQWMNLAGTPNIQFCLATEDPDGNPTDGIDRVQMTVTGTTWSNGNINSEIKPSTNWDPERYLNIYVLSIPGTTAAGGIVGFSNYPTQGQVGGATDGPVIDYRWFGGPGFAVSGYRPLTHELGHFFGLPHTFNGSSCSTDDNIEDTPNVDATTASYADLDCTSSYPPAPQSCGNDHLYVNFMDYVWEVCYTSFTQGQVNVIRSVMDGTSSQFNYGSRQSLVTNAPLLCDLPANDAGIVRLISPQGSYCTAGPVAPEVTLRNFGTEHLTSADISYSVNGGQPVLMQWQGDLFPGQNTDLVLPAFLPPNGLYTIEIFTENPNGQPDDRAANDTLSADQLANVATEPPLVEDFENETGLPTNTGFFGFNPNADPLLWLLNGEASGFGEGTQSAVIDNFAAVGLPGSLGSIDALISRHFDLSEMTGTELHFDVAYAPFNAVQSDTLFVLVATECSQNFDQLAFVKGGSQLATAPASQAEFTPTAQQWRTEVVDLSFFDGVGDVTIALVNKTGWGNRLFLDNIKVGRSCSALSAEWETVPDGCSSFCTGGATVTIPESNGGLSYQWEGWPVAHNQPTIYQLCPGTATVTVTDAFGCEIIASTEIPAAPSPEGSTTSTDVTGGGTNDGTATVNVSNGTPPFAYSWSNGANESSNSFSHTISNLPTGGYTVTVTDATDCSSVFEATVGSACSAFSLDAATTFANCFGEANGSATAMMINGTAPFTFEWNNGATTQTASGLTAGQYMVTVTDANSCAAQKTVQVGQPPALELDASATSETALNAQDGTVSVTAEGGTPGYQYLWDNGATTPTQTGLPPGTYAVIVTDLNGCQAFETVTIQPFTCEDFASVISWTNVTCFGLADGTAEVEVTGETPPLSINWSNGEMTATIGGLTAMEYTVTVSDGAGCEAELVASVLQPALLVANATATNETAPNAEDGTASAMPSGGLSTPGNPYEVVWSTSETTFVIENLVPGFYTVTVTDANDCTAEETVEVQGVGCNLSIQTSVTPASCPTLADGLAIVTEVPGGAMPLNYAWSNGDMDPFAENLAAAEYTVTVTDGNGCSTSTIVTVTADDVTPPTLFLQNATLELGADGLALLNAEDVDDGSSDNCGTVGFSLSQNEFTCTDLGTWDVEVTGTDDSGNEASGTVSVTVLDLVPPTITCPSDLTVNTCDAIFYDDPVAEDNCGNVDFEILEGLESGEIFPAGETTVIFEATDFSDNTASCSFTITVEYDLAAEMTGQDPSCTGDSDGLIDLVILGGLSPYQAEWSHGGIPSGLPAGEYTVTVTDQNGCTTEQSVVLDDPPPFSAEVTGVTHAVNSSTPGSIALSINGGVTPWVLVWSENGAVIPGFDPSAAPPGNYDLEISDQNGCVILLTGILVDNLNNAADRLLDQQIDLFPNPTNGVLFVKTTVPVDASVSLELFDVTGKLHLNTTFSISQNQPQRVDVSSLGSGVFWAKIQSGAAVAWRKVVVL